MRSWVSIVTLLGWAAAPASAGDMGATSSGRAAISATLPPRVTIRAAEARRDNEGAICLQGRAGEFSAVIERAGTRVEVPAADQSDVSCTAIRDDGDGVFTMLVVPE